VNLDIKPKNIFIDMPDIFTSEYKNWISMDLGSALVIDYKKSSKYYVQVATKEYCSAKFWDAFKKGKPLSYDDLIKEDHY
jgi:hypothetical protein